MNDEAKRGLTLIAKTLQNLANGVTFGKKEMFMEPMNEFIESHTEECLQYFEAVSFPKQTRHTKQLNNHSLEVYEKREHLEGILDIACIEWTTIEQKCEGKEWIEDLRSVINIHKQRQKKSKSSSSLRRTNSTMRGTNNTMRGTDNTLRRSTEKTD